MHRRVPRAPGKALATAALLTLSMAGGAGAAGPGNERFSLSGGAPIRPVRRRVRRLAVPVLTRPPAPAEQARRDASRSWRDRLLGLLVAVAGIWAAVALVLAVLVALAVTLAFILVIGLAVASAAPRGPADGLPRAPGRYIPVRENPAVALAGRRWAGSTTSVVHPTLPPGPAAVTR
jgi:hypothetical protein